MSKVPKRPDMESKYFSTVELDKIRRMNIKKKEEVESDELKRLKDLHFKKCSACGWDVEEITFKGVTIFKCFSCGGVHMNEETFDTLFSAENGILKSILEIFKF
ncbi:zf-TFIIB domain-containing protein [bacterium]|nr:zf-TFIIB domain-containing protein [bacterium]